MRTLVVIPHYFSPQSGEMHSSADHTRAEERKTNVHTAITAWSRVLGGPHAMADFDSGRPYRINKRLRDITVLLATANHKYLADVELCKGLDVTMLSYKMEDPKLLGFRCAALLAENIHNYDNFIFAEDDILVTDSLLIEKIRWFQSQFGYRRLLLPSRVERAIDDTCGRTFIDGNLQPSFRDVGKSFVVDEEYLSAIALGTTWSFARAKNPHSGMYVLTREQLQFWMDQSHWLDHDISFVGPLESAATLGLIKTFSVYKCYGRCVDYLTVEHLDNRYSSVLVNGDMPHHRLS